MNVRKTKINVATRNYCFVDKNGESCVGCKDHVIHCPTCGEPLSYDDEGSNFCKECGQKLIWYRKDGSSLLD